MKVNMKLFFLVCFLIISLSSFAQIYEYSDDHGNYLFSNRPPINISMTHVKETQKLPAMNAYSLSEQNKTVPHQETNPSNTLPTTNFIRLDIVSPINHQTFWNVSTIPVKLSITPHPKTSVIQIFVDGSSYGPPTTQTELIVENLNRGRHEIYAQLLLANKEIIATSQPVIIFIHETSKSTH